MVAAYGLFWLLMLIKPFAWFNWWLENLLVLATGVYLTLTFRWFRFSNLSYAMIIVFVALHTYGAHFSYYTTPVDVWMQEWFGFQRNNFDRIVHFGFGLLIVYPVREFGVRVMDISPRWAYGVAPSMVLAFGAFYEIVEMWVAAVVNPEAGTRFVGTQGDVWDSVHDIEMALYGALITMLAAAAAAWFRGRRNRAIG